jgi:nucleoside-diphosphate-sugar epimerase
MSKVLVTGATGFAGSHLAKRLIDQGRDVRILARPTADLSKPELVGAEVFHGDLTDENSVVRALDGVDTVFHIAALFRKAKLPDRAYWAVNYEGARTLLSESLKRGVQRFVHCSTVGVLGHISNPPANETAPYNPGDIYQTTKCEAEKEALRLWRERGLPVTVVRPAGIYGPGDTRWLKMFRGIAAHRFPMVGSGNTFIHLVYIDDLVDAFLLASETPAAIGQVYIAGGDRYVTLNEFADAVAKAVDRPMPRLHVPVGPVHLISGICEDLCRAIRIEPPLYRRRVDFFVKDRAFDISKARRDLGYSPKIGLEEGIGRTVDWYRKRGWL